jgi:hypothetical protein
MPPEPQADQPDDARPGPGPLTRSTARLLGGAFSGLARLRHGKPIHTLGSVHRIRIERRGSRRRWGVPWLDEPGVATGVGRFSRAVGLPSPLPDVFGLALRFTGAGGTHHDLLLSTTGFGRGTRHLLLPRRDPARSTYTTVVPYRTGGDVGVLLMARPLRRPGSAPDFTALRFVLAAATLGSGWEPFGLVSLWPGDPAGVPDAPVSFDPVRHPLPGLRLPEPLATLRAVSYRSARQGRGASAGELSVDRSPQG